MNRRGFLQTILATGAAPWVASAAGVLMPSARVWSRDFNFLHNVRWSADAAERIVRNAPMRLKEMPENLATKNVVYYEPEIQVGGVWMLLGRTDLYDDISTGLVAKKTVDEWRVHYAEKAASGYGCRHHCWPHGEGFTIIDALTDG